MENPCGAAMELNLNKIITICEVEDYEILYEYKRQFQKKLTPKPTRSFKKEMAGHNMATLPFNQV